MSEKAIMATHDGVLRVGNVELECHVLEDGQRVFSAMDLLKAMNLNNLLINQKSHPQIFNRFLDRIHFISFENEELAALINEPILFKVSGRGGALRRGYTVELLPAICDTIVKQALSRSLPVDLYPAVDPCQRLQGAFAKVGIIALVDEATGYQRDKQTLQEMLDKFLAKEQSAWAKRFPDVFYRELFRLRGWEWRGMRVNRPSVVGTYTKKIVYNRLAPGLLAELEKKNPADDTGNRKARHHQWLTPDVGHPALNMHLAGVIALMKASTTWKGFWMKLVRVYPCDGDQDDLFADDEA